MPIRWLDWSRHRQSHVGGCFILAIALAVLTASLQHSSQSLERVCPAVLPQMPCPDIRRQLYCAPDAGEHHHCRDEAKWLADPLRTDRITLACSIKTSTIFSPLVCLLLVRLHQAGAGLDMRQQFWFLDETPQAHPWAEGPVSAASSWAPSRPPGGGVVHQTSGRPM